MGRVELDLAQVRAFVATADRQSMSQAAVALHLSQQALSKRIRRLENTVGMLFERGATGVELTPTGARFLPAARHLLATAEAALSAARAEPLTPLRVDVWGHLHEPLRLIRRFAETYSQASVELSMRRNLPQALGALQRREVDLAFGDVLDLPGALPTGLLAELVAVSPLAALVNRTGPLGRATLLRPSHLAACRLWTPFGGSSPELAAFVRRSAAELAVPLDTGGANLGVDVLVAHVAADPEAVTLYDPEWGVPADERVRLVPLDPAPRFPWYAVWAPDPLHPWLKRLLDFLPRIQPTVVTADQRLLDD
jgi:DNA-binding transcriptional LysR family regulator